MSKVTICDLEQDIIALYDTVVVKEFARNYSVNKPERSMTIPFKDLYFKKGNHVTKSGNATLVYVLIAVGILLLASALFNYINLSVALAGKRSKEMAIRSTLGESGGRIRWRYISESILFVAVCLALAWLLAKALEPLFNRYMAGEVGLEEIQGDDGYFQILGLKEKQDNHQRAWWLNEYAFKQIGIEESETEYVTSTNGSLPIGGVYYDFKVRPLESAQSAAMVYNWKESPEDNFPWVLLVKTNGDQAAARKKVEAIVDEVFPGRMFDARYIEEMIEDGFKDESRVLKIVLIFTLLSILVSALGLFAMSSYYMQQEIRSVSVKKVFGADYSGVLRELVLSFMKLVGIAFVIGVPIAWFIMNRWLSGYGHRIDLHWWIFVLAGLAVAFIAAISVLYQSIKTAQTNPAEALKKE